MSRKILFEINDLLGEISIRGQVGRAGPAFRALWMNFHRVYPEARLVC
jgi:hypothetical protein